MLAFFAFFPSFLCTGISSSSLVSLAAVLGCVLAHASAPAFVFLLLGSFLALTPSSVLVPRPVPSLLVVNNGSSAAPAYPIRYVCYLSSFPPSPPLRLLRNPIIHSDFSAMDYKKSPNAKPRLTCTCLVGSNAISAFLSWRLQATTSCDVTLVWKSGFESVAQYGVSFKYAVLWLLWTLLSQPVLTHALARSKIFGNERFKPRHGTVLLLRVTAFSGH